GFTFDSFKQHQVPIDIRGSLNPGFVISVSILSVKLFDDAGFSCPWAEKVIELWNESDFATAVSAEHGPIMHQSHLHAITCGAYSGADTRQARAHHHQLIVSSYYWSLSFGSSHRGL